MLKVTLHRYNGSLPLFQSELVECSDIIFVDVESSFFPGQKHRLQGFDNYWVDLNSHTFGVFNDPENYEMYEGSQYFSYRWKQSGHEILNADFVIPDSAIIVAGIMVPDETAVELGLL